MKQTLSERIVKKVTIVYYAIYALTILSAFGGYLLNINSEAARNPQSDTSIALSTFVIAYIIISVPAAFALFNYYLKKWLAIQDENIKLEKYATGATLRLIAIGSGLILSIVAFYILRTESMMFCAGIAAIALIFAKPTEARVFADLKLDETEE